MIEKECRDDFYREITDIGMTFANGKIPKESDTGTFTAVNRNNTIAYISAFIFGKVHDGKDTSMHKNILLASYRKLTRGENPILKDCR